MKARMMLMRTGMKKGFSSKYALMFYLVSALITITVQYFLWKAVLIGKADIVFKQTISYLVLMQFMSLIFPKSSYDLNDEVQSGDISLTLLKPMSLSTKLFWEGVGFSIAKIIVIGFVEIIIYFLLTPTVFTIFSLLMVLITMILAYILYFELELILGAFSFYTYSIWGITTLKSAILLIFSGNLFPLNYYPAIIRKIAEVLPFQYSFGSVGMVIENNNWGNFWNVITMQLIYIVIFRIVYKLMMKHSIKSIVIQGG